MRKIEFPITGIIHSKDRNITFYQDEFAFTFMDASISPLQLVEIQPEHQFLHGRTRNGSNIAIYAGSKPFAVYGSASIETGAFIISNYYDDSKLTSFRAIKFCGGILNKLYEHDSFDFESNSQSAVLINMKDNHEQYEFTFNNMQCKMTIGSYTSMQFGSNVMKSQIGDGDIELTIEFPSEQSLETIINVYNSIKDMVSFMAFRRNVRFDRIVLMQYKVLNLPSEFTDEATTVLDDFATAYFKEDKEITSKDCRDCLHFSDFGESITNFLELFFNYNEENISYMLGFIPNSDFNARMMSSGKVREICSSLECELSYVKDLCEEESSDLPNLIKKVKNVVKEHRNGEKPLSEKTYDLIFGSIRQWSMSASDRIYLLYERHWKAVSKLKPVKCFINKESITQLVKYRNDITHGRSRVIDFHIAGTASAMIAVVYCCLLSRIGMTEEEIIALSNNKEYLLK